MADAHKNLAYSTVLTAPSPSTSGTTLVVPPGEGARFPATPFNATVWPTGTIPIPSNAEIVRVTNIATDTLTIVRAQEGTSARSIILGDQIAATVTAKTLTDIEDPLSNVLSAASALSVAIAVVSNAVSNEASIRTAADNVLSQGLSVLSQQVSVLSQAHSVLSQALSNETSNRASADNVLSQAISVISQQVSVLSQAHSVLSQRLSTLRGGTSGQVLKKNTATDFDWSWQADQAGGGGSVDVTSNKISTLSQNISVLSQQVSVLSQAHSVLSQAHSALSSQVSTLSALVSNLTSAHNALSNVVSDSLSIGNVASNTLSNVLSLLSLVSVKSAGGTSVRGLQSALNALSNRISAGGGGAGSVTSNELSAVSAQAASAISQLQSVLSQAISVVSNALSNEISNRTSADNVLSLRMQSILSVDISALSQAHSVLSQALSNEISNRSSAVNVVSQAVSVLSQQVSVLSQQVSVLSQAHSVLSTLIAGVSVKSVGGTSVKGLQSILNALSNRISATAGGSGSVTSTEVSAVSAQAASAINVVSNALSALSVTVSNLISAHNALSNVLSDSLSAGNVASNLLSNAVSAISAMSTRGPIISVQNVDTSAISAGYFVYAFTSANTFKRTDPNGGFSVRLPLGVVIDTSIAVSGIGRVQVDGIVSLTSAQWDQVVSGQTTGLAAGRPYYLDDNAPGRITGSVPGSGSQVVVGVALDGNRMVLNRNTDALNAGGGGGSVTSTELSAVSAQAASAISQLTSLHNVLSNVVSNALSAGDVASNAISIISAKLASVISVEISVHSQAISVLSQQISVLSQQVSVHSQQISTLSQAISALGQPQLNRNTNIITVSATGLTNVSGLSISVAANGIYKVEGMLLHTHSAANAFGFGFTFPGMKTNGAGLQMIGVVSIAAAGGLAVSTIRGFGALNENGSGSIMYSAVAGASAVTYVTQFQGLFNVSTAGTIQVQARVSATGTGAIHIVPGSYIQAFKLA